VGRLELDRHDGLGLVGLVGEAVQRDVGDDPDRNLAPCRVAVRDGDLGAGQCSSRRGRVGADGCEVVVAVGDDGPQRRQELLSDELDVALVVREEVGRLKVAQGGVDLGLGGRKEAGRGGAAELGEAAVDVGERVVDDSVDEVGDVQQVAELVHMSKVLVRRRGRLGGRARDAAREGEHDGGVAQCESAQLSYEGRHALELAQSSAERVCRASPRRAAMRRGRRRLSALDHDARPLERGAPLHHAAANSCAPSTALALAWCPRLVAPPPPPRHRLVVVLTPRRPPRTRPAQSPQPTSRSSASAAPPPPHHTPPPCRARPPTPRPQPRDSPRAASRPASAPAATR